MVVNWDSVINYRSKKIITRKKVVLIAGRKADLWPSAGDGRKVCRKTRIKYHRFHSEWPEKAACFFVYNEIEGRNATPTPKSDQGRINPIFPLALLLENRYNILWIKGSKGRTLVEKRVRCAAATPPAEMPDAVPDAWDFYHIFPFWAGCDKGLFLCLCRYY